VIGMGMIVGTCHRVAFRKISLRTLQKTVLANQPGSGTFRLFWDLSW
jgi:hypothetical protein